MFFSGLDPLHLLTEKMEKDYILRVDIEKNDEKAFGIWNNFELVTWVFSGFDTQ